MSFTPAKRSTVVHLVKTGKSASDWHIVNEGVTELSESFNPETDTLQYVAEDNATTVVKRYAPSISLSAVMVEEKDTNGKPSNPDEVNKWILNTINTLPIGSSADTEYIRFTLHDLKGDTFNEKGSNTYTGYKRKAVISVDSIGGAAGDNVGMELTLNGKGDATEVDVTFSKKTDGSGFDISVTDPAAKP